MYYKIVEYFGPDSGKRWSEYLEWRSLNLTHFDSIDRYLRPDLFEPESKEDWDHCVNEDYKINLITDLNYARQILDRYENSILIGVEEEPDNHQHAESISLLGFDILDSYMSVSLLTNWGKENFDTVDPEIESNGLIGNLQKAREIRNFIESNFNDDPYAQNCRIWAVYEVLNI